MHFFKHLISSFLGQKWKFIFDLYKKSENKWTSGLLWKRYYILKEWQLLFSTNQKQRFYTYNNLWLFSKRKGLERIIDFTISYKVNILTTIKYDNRL